MASPGCSRRCWTADCSAEPERRAFVPMQLTRASGRQTTHARRLPGLAKRESAPTIVVLGGINMDLIATAPRLPMPGETVRGGEFYTAPGGKGANRAVAAARLGASVRMAGRVGKDTFGPSMPRGSPSSCWTTAGRTTSPPSTVPTPRAAIRSSRPRHPRWTAPTS